MECEISFGPLAFGDQPLDAAGDAPTRQPTSKSVDGGRLVRERQEMRGELTVTSEPDGDLRRVSVRVANTGAARKRTRTTAIARSMIGTHLIAEVVGGRVRLAARAAASPRPTRCPGAAGTAASRCWPARPGTDDMLLISPIILYDHPEIAEQSDTALYDSTEIDEILTLRVMTMTDEEKAQARATDPRAAQIIDQCDAMSPEAMARLHGVLRDPHALD